MEQVYVGEEIIRKQLNEYSKKIAAISKLGNILGIYLYAGRGFIVIGGLIIGANWFPAANSYIGFTLTAVGALDLSLNFKDAVLVRKMASVRAGEFEDIQSRFNQQLALVTMPEMQKTGSTDSYRMNQSNHLDGARELHRLLRKSIDEKDLSILNAIRFDDLFKSGV